MKRALSLLLALVMCFSLLPTAVFAEEPVTEESAQEEPAAETEEPAETAEEAEEPAEAPAEEEAPAQPTEEPAEPAEENAESAEEPAEPAEDAAEPAEEPAEPTGESTEEPTEPEAALEGENILTAENFPDENLLSMLTGMFNGCLTAEQAADETTLYIAGWDVADFTGINKYFTGLVNLQTYYNPIKTLDVSALTNLQYLKCYGCSDLTTVILPINKAESQLTELNLIGSGIKEIELSGYNSLGFIYLDDCKQLEKISIIGGDHPIIMANNTAISAITTADIPTAQNL